MKYNISKNVIKKIVFISIINIILITSFLITQKFPILINMFSLRISNLLNIYPLWTCTLIHKTSDHIISNLIHINIVFFFILFNKDKWYHLLFLMLFVGMGSGIGYCLVRPFRSIIGISGIQCGLLLYATLSSKNHPILQTFLLLFTIYWIVINYLGLYYGAPDIGYDIHLLGYGSAFIYQVSRNIINDFKTRFIKFFNRRKKNNDNCY